MGANGFITLKKTHFDFLFGFMHGFLYRNMFPVVGSFWIFLSKFIVYVFGSILGYLFRFSTNRCVVENDSGASSDSNCDKLKEKQSSDYVDQGNRESENSALVASSSKYEFLYEKGITAFIEEPETESYTVHEFYVGSNEYATSNGRILVSRDAVDGDIGKFKVEAEDVNEEKAVAPGESFTVEKVLENLDVIDERETEDPVEEKADDFIESFTQLEETNSVFENKTEESALRFFFEKRFEKQIEQEQSVEAKVRVEEKAEDSVGSSIVESTLEKPEQDVIKTEDVFKEKAKASVENFIVEKSLEKPNQVKEIETEYILEVKADESVENHVIKKILEKHLCDIESSDDHIEEKFVNFFDSPVIDMYLEKWHREKEEKMFSQTNKVEVESITHEVLANNLDLRPQSYRLTDGQKVEKMEHEIHDSNRNISDQEPAIIGDPIDDSDNEFIELEPWSEELFLMGETESGEDLSIDDTDDEEDFNDKETESMVSPEKTKEPTLQEEFISSYEEQEDDSEFGSDSEHDDLIERLKMELKMARTGGLATILEEESESPKMMEELGPLQIDEKYDYKHHIAEIQKVYRSYSDKMKKLDILNSQTTHAISLLQLKGPVRLSSTFGKSSATAIKSLLSHNVWSFKQRKLEADPAMKLIRDLHKDFETVYVGQVCLSWEILHWQYGKFKELSESDRLGVHHYNQVVGEFQHFQVLVQRFLEDEPFQTRPRVENYVKKRCALRHLLQVPVIKDDCSKYKEDEVLSNEMLTDIIEESMHVFWDFLRADEGDANLTSKTAKQAQVAPHDPIDLELLMDIRTDLQKKEKKLKEIQRITNCIIKKFQRQHQGNLLDHTMFIAQVELKLVSRVLNMLKITTDQLVWCHEKLQRINFSRRRIEIEPSFTLFPC